MVLHRLDLDDALAPVVALCTRSLRFPSAALVRLGEKGDEQLRVVHHSDSESEVDA